MFYERFYELCQSMGVTPTQAARDVAIRQSTVSMWKKQRTTPKYDTLQKLAHYFGVSIDYLLDRGPRFDPVFPTRRIFQVIYRKNSSLEEMSQRTGISLETIRTFALGGQVVNGKECIEKIAKELDVPPAFLLGWTNHPLDEGGYWNIDENIWIGFNNDPDSAYGAYQALEPDNVDYEFVWDTLTDVGFTLKSAGIVDGCGTGGDMYYLWHVGAKDPEEERVILPFREMLRIVAAVQADAEQHKKDYLRKRFDAEWF